MSYITIPYTIAIDFDGCLCENRFPAVGRPNWPVIHEALLRKQQGAKLILWTCREGDYLRDAIDACLRWGLVFDAVNENIPEWTANGGNKTRKVVAMEYWDDNAVVKRA